MSIFIKNVLYNGENTNVYIEENLISYIGPEEKKAKTALDGSNKAIFPALGNGHTHAAMTLFRGSGDDMPLQEWLTTKIWPREAKLNEEHIYWGTKLACLEMIKSGTTLFNDMYWFSHKAVEAVEQMGIRAVLSTVFVDTLGEAKSQEQRQKCKEHLQLCKDFSRIQPALGPHAIYTVSSKTLEWISEFATENDVLVHFHLSETQKEVEDCIKEHGKRPTMYLNELGFLSQRLVAAHCVWLDNEELDILAEKKVKLVHNPCANLKLAVGKAFRYAEIRKRSIKACLGTDGSGSNNNLDILEELKFAALLQKWENNDPTVMPCKEAWQMATQNAFEIFRLNAGSIEVGKLADIILVDLNHVQMTPAHDLVSNLVYAANGEVIDTVICNGKILMQNRQVPGEQEIIAKAKEATQSLFSL